MKIAFIASGKSIHSYKWIRSFSEEHDIIWISISGFDSKFLHDKNIKYFDYNFSRSNLINSIIGLFKIIIDVKKLDVLHLHYIGFHALTTLFLRATPIVVTAWGSDVVFAEKSIFKTFFLSYYLKKAQLITCDSAHMKSKILNLSGKTPVELINFGIDTKEFKKRKFDHGLKKEISLISNNIIISTRNHELVYDIDTVIKSARIVVNTCPDALFIIAGSGSLTSSLRIEVENLLLTESVIFVGSLSSIDILRYLSVTSIYVSSALSDGGIAASTAEAMSAEVPCIVTDVADNSEWIEDGVTGMLFKVQDERDLAHKILFLLKDANLRNMIGKRSRALIQKNNDIHNEMNKMGELYTLLAN